MRQHKKTVVIGLGNTLMTDEGIGIHVVRALADRRDLHSRADFVELGTSMMGVVHAIAGRRKAVIVDCARMGEPSGSMRRFSPDEVVSGKTQPGLSLHEGDLISALELSRQLGECPEEVVIFGIQPEYIGPADSLSPALRERLDEYARLLSRELGTLPARP